eukprot:31528-Chlamydomonas_euryale.AAC.2
MGKQQVWASKGTRLARALLACCTSRLNMIWPAGGKLLAFVLRALCQSSRGTTNVVRSHTKAPSRPRFHIKSRRVGDSLGWKMGPSYNHE